MDGFCSVDGCYRKAIVKGMCNKHYQRMRYKGVTIGKSHEYHGMRSSPEYKSWSGMKERCNNPNNDSYERYGGRGISVCKAWDSSFVRFLNNVGRKPFKGAQIDRIDNDGNYEPGNCRWTDRTTNMRNSTTTKLTRIEVDEIRILYSKGDIPYKELASIYGVGADNISRIVKYKTWRE